MKASPYEKGKCYKSNAGAMRKDIRIIAGLQQRRRFFMNTYPTGTDARQTGLLMPPVVYQGSQIELNRPIKGVSFRWVNGRE